MPIFDHVVQQRISLRESYPVVETPPVSVDRARSTRGSHALLNSVRFVVGTTCGLADTASSMLPISIGLEDAMRSHSFLRHLLAAAVLGIFELGSPSVGFATALPHGMDFSVTRALISSAGITVQPVGSFQYDAATAVFSNFIVTPCLGHADTQDRHSCGLHGHGRSLIERVGSDSPPIDPTPVYVSARVLATRR